MALAELLTVLGSVLLLPTLIYFWKYPHEKGKPFSRTQKLMMIPVILSVCCLLAAGPQMATRF